MGAFFVDKPESCGPLVPTLEGKVIDADGNDLPHGETGELCVKGGNVIKGYLNRDEATAESIQNGWLRTGDIARMDEHGFVFIVDRAKDMVLRGGENIYCAEVESALFKHDAVAECTVFGVEDERLGEEVGAAVVAVEGVEIDVEELRAHCAKLLANFKIPRYIWLRTEKLPRNASGKFLKRELRDNAGHSRRGLNHRSRGKNEGQSGRYIPLAKICVYYSAFYIAGVRASMGF